jgi:ATP-dependent helicase/nuclease subunit A
MHRLLELYRPGLDLRTCTPAIGADFHLNAAQSTQALEAALCITQGQAAWVWDSRVIDWQANEIELMHQDQLLRIDRLVKRRDTQTWWVLDYKSNAAPQRMPELSAQLAQYREAVQLAHPNQAIKAAFITAQGRLIEI